MIFKNRDFVFGARLQARRQMRSMGYGFREINEVVNQIDGDVIADFDRQNGGTLAAQFATASAAREAEGERPFLDFLKQLFASPEFQAFLKMLIMALIGL